MIKVKSRKRSILISSVILLSILFLFYFQNKFVELNSKLQCVKESKLDKIEIENQIIEVIIERNLQFIKLTIFENDTGYFYNCKCFNKIIDNKLAEFKDTIIFDTDKLLVIDKSIEKIIETIKKEIDNYPKWKKSERQYYGSCIKVKRFNSKTNLLKTINCHSSSYSTQFNDKLGYEINLLLKMTKSNEFSNYYKLFLSGPQGI